MKAVTNQSSFSGAQLPLNCPHCEEAFAPGNSLQLYCSGRCSARVRNRRYYATPRGRQKKREAQKRHFLRNRQKYYDARRQRMEKGVREMLASEEHKHAIGIEAGGTLRPYGSSIEPIREKIALRFYRLRHDYHPAAHGESPDGRWLWLPTRDGKMRMHHYPPRLRPEFQAVYEMDRNGKLVRIGSEEQFPL